MSTRHLIIEGFPSRHVSPRNVSIWLPAEGPRKSRRRHRVLYAQDGQNLFDPSTSFAGVDWGMGECLDRLACQRAVDETLIVGVWNTARRLREYDPGRLFREHMSVPERARYARKMGEPLGDAYLRFLVEELKPFVDARFPTRPEREHTLLCGSSMGGIVSLYGVCEYPEVFGGAACLSTHWPTGRGRMVDYLAGALPAAGAHLFYFDRGTDELDGSYGPYQEKADQVLRRAGYREGHDWVSHVFAGTGHSEAAWRARVHLPLQFLLGRRAPG